MIRLMLCFLPCLAAALVGLSAPACEAQALRPGTAGPRVHVIETPFAVAPGNTPRTLRIHLPHGYEDGHQRYPVLYLHDAQNLFDLATAYAGEWGADESMDALQREYGFVAIVVGIDHGGDRRLNELSPWPHPAFGAGEGAIFHDALVHRIKPWIDANFRTRPDRASTAIGGSSFGGLAAHYAIHRYPDVFSRALVFSPSYWVSEQVYMHSANVALPSDARVYLMMGGNEGWQALSDVERMHALLAAMPQPAAHVALRLVPGAAHNEAAWRAEFPRALRWLYELESGEGEQRGSH